MDTEKAEITRIEPANKRGGRWITFGEEAYCVPALSAIAFQQLSDRIVSLQTASSSNLTPEHMDNVLEIIRAALMRNYPDITREQVADMIDLSNLHDVIDAVLNTTPSAPTPAAAP